MKNVLAKIRWTIKFILEIKGLEVSEHSFCAWMRLMIDLINNNKNGQ